MKVMVTVKRVVDPYVRIKVSSSSNKVDTQQLKHTINPFDEIALEEAVRWLEQGIVTDILVISIGTASSQETLRHALALGATRAKLIETEQALSSFNIAQILSHVASDEKPDVILMGKQAIDDDNNQVPQMLAALLDVPQATYASHIKIQSPQAIVTRETEYGSETLKLNLPAVISVDLRLNQPRYASLPNIMKARQKPLESVHLETLNLDLKTHQRILSVAPPKVRQAGVKVKTVDELIQKLRIEAKIL